jgi:hypothetical protein
VTPTATADPPPAVVAASPRSRFPLRLGALVLVAWLVALGLMVLGTANPVQVSPAQVRAAHAVVTGKRTGDFQIEVDRVWSGTLRNGPVSVANLDGTNMPRDGRFIVPLSRFKTAWQVTVLPEQRIDRPLVYPVTPESLATMRKALRK